MAKRPSARSPARPAGNPAVNKPVQDRDPYMDGSGGWAIPELTAGLTFKEWGSSGLRQYGGWVREEFLPQLLGRQAARAYREMYDNSPVVGAVMFAIQQTMRKVEWRTQGVADTGPAKAMEDFADSLRFDMSHTWEDFITEALSMLVYGYAPHEIVYKRRLGKSPPGGGDTRDANAIPRSEFDDGLVGLRRLPVRGQDTILKWFFSVNGDILGLTQQPWIGQLIDIPIEKMLLFRPGAHKNNPEGRSILRTAYRPYYFIKRLEEQEAIWLERMSGVPVLQIPSAILEAGNVSGNAAGQAALQTYKNMITNIRMDEQMGVLLPSDRYAGGTGASPERMFEFRLEVPSGRATAGFDVSIGRYKTDILMSVLADFIQLGHTARGTQNLALSKVDMFFQAIEGWLNSIAGVLNRHLLPKIWGLNGFDPELMPEYVPDLAQRVDLDAMGNFVLHLSQAGAQLFPDLDLENYLRDAGGLPDISDEAAYNAAGAASDTDVLAKILKGSIARRLKKQREAGPALPIRTDIRKNDWTENADVAGEELCKAARRHLKAIDDNHWQTPFKYDADALEEIAQQHPSGDFLHAMVNQYKDAPIKKAPLASLWATHPIIDKEHLARQSKNDGDGATVVRWKSRDYIVDGHHQLTARWLRGKKNAKVRFVDMSPGIDPTTGQVVGSKEENHVTDGGKIPSVVT
jgi:hypothetical protein